MLHILMGGFTLLFLWTDFYEVNILSLKPAEMACCADIWMTDAWDTVGVMTLPTSW